MKRQWRGFGLLELLVSLAMGVILLLVLWEVHAATARSSAYRHMLMDLTSEGQLLQRMFSHRLLQAGFWGYRHIDSDYAVMNFVCPNLLGSQLVAERLVTQADGQHIQTSYLDNQVVEIETLHDENTVSVSRTSLFKADMVVGIGDLSQGWVTKIAKVSQRGKTTELTLTTALPALTLPAVVAEFHGIDDSVSPVNKAMLGLWEQPCDAKRGLIVDDIKAWDVYVHPRGTSGFTKTPSTSSIINGLKLDILLQSRSPILTAPMHYRWQEQQVLANDKRFYLPWQIVMNLGQVVPLT